MKNKLLMLILIFLLLLVSVPSAWSYFFTYTKATGTITINLLDDSDIDECVVDNVKEVTVTAKPNSDPVFIRVRVFKASDVAVSYQGDGWALNGDYYYYNIPIDGVDGGLFADNAVISFTVSIPSENVENPPVYTEDETRHVVVIYEGTPALFTTVQPTSGTYWTQKDGDTVIGYWYANWEKTLPQPTVGGGN